MSILLALGLCVICLPGAHSKSPCACWESNLGPLREQLVLGTSEPSPAPVYKRSYFSHCNSIAYDTLKLTLKIFFFFAT